MNCDMHLHSTYSDGTFTPGEIVAEARRLNLAVALTDHNTVSGLPEFLTEAERQGVAAVPGIELSTSYKGIELHLLGLFIAPEHYGRIEETVEKFHVLKEQSNKELIERLNAAGYEIDYGEVKSKNSTGHFNRAHVAAVLCEKGYVGSRDEAFNSLLEAGKGFYTPPQRLLLTDAIKLLREIKAVPVLAHPLHDIDEATLRELLPEALEAGLLGMEIIHSSYDDEKLAAAAKIAAEYGLHPSGGSDFHGGNKPNISMGVGKGNISVPLDYYNNLKSLQQSL